MDKIQEIAPAWLALVVAMEAIGCDQQTMLDLREAVIEASIDQDRSAEKCAAVGADIGEALHVWLGSTDAAKCETGRRQAIEAITANQITRATITLRALQSMLPAVPGVRP